MRSRIAPSGRAIPDARARCERRHRLRHPAAAPVDEGGVGQDLCTSGAVALHTSVHNGHGIFGGGLGDVPQLLVRGEEQQVEVGHDETAKRRLGPERGAGTRARVPGQRAVAREAVVLTDQAGDSSRVDPVAQRREESVGALVVGSRGEDRALHDVDEPEHPLGPGHEVQVGVYLRRRGGPRRRFVGRWRIRSASIHKCRGEGQRQQPTGRKTALPPRTEAPPPQCRSARRRGGLPTYCSMATRSGQSGRSRAQRTASVK
jgi:hypothetical protein